MGEQPLILAFCCHYCAYAAADLAGSMRLQYPDNVRVLRLPCTGKVEVNHILTAFERGVDGVMVAGCLEGEPERVEMYNLSSAEGARFAEIVTEMSERLGKLDPSPLRPDREAAERGVREMSRQAEATLAGERR